MHVYFEYVCFIFASSCKRGITVIIGGPLASNKEHSGINDCLEDNREKRIIRTAITVTYAHPLQFLQFQAWVDFFGGKGGSVKVKLFVLLLGLFVCVHCLER